MKRSAGLRPAVVRPPVGRPSARATRKESPDQRPGDRGPEVRTPCPELIEFLQPFPSNVIELALATRAKVIALAPNANETMWDAYNAVSIGFAYTGTFVHIAVYAKHVNLGFNNGAHLPDPKNVL